jgi:hypothetical protein
MEALEPTPDQTALATELAAALVDSAQGGVVGRSRAKHSLQSQDLAAHPPSAQLLRWPKRVLRVGVRALIARCGSDPLLPLCGHVARLRWHRGGGASNGRP